MDYTRFSNTKIVDLTAPLGEHTYCYPTDPQFHKIWHERLPDGVANASKVEMGLHNGTHVDAPLHFIEDGMDVSQLPLQAFFGSAIAIDAPKKLGDDIYPDDLVDADIRTGDIVLVSTGWGARINTDKLYEDSWPGFSIDAIDYLIEKGVKAIGGDMPAADSFSGPSRGFPAHKRILSAGLPIFETLMNLDQVAGKRFQFFGLPLRIEQGEASPIRAIAILED